MEEREFKILCIDGGGARGIYPAHILKRIQEELKIDFLEEFDLIAGTSTGSIIAAGIACELPLDTICSMYENMTEKIFKKRFMSGNGIITSKYSNEELKKILEQNFGNKKMGELKIKLLIPSTDLGNGQVYVHKTPYNPEFVRDGETLVRHAVLSSCMAPIYFDPEVIKNGKGEEYLLADGGLWANNPSMLAFVEAMNPKRLNNKMENIKLLSLGTGISKKFYDLNNKKWGLKDYRTELIDIIMSLQSTSPHNMLTLLLGEEQYLRINFEREQSLPLDKFDAQIKSRAGSDYTHNHKKIEKFFKGEK